MSFYSKLEFNQLQDDRVLTIYCGGKNYSVEPKFADIKFDQESNLLIFTTRDKYRYALNCSYISSIQWDVSV